MRGSDFMAIAVRKGSNACITTYGRVKKIVVPIFKSLVFVNNSQFLYIGNAHTNISPLFLQCAKQCNLLKTVTQK